MITAIEQACLLDGARGIYIPQAFAQNFNMRAWGVSEKDEQILLAGPEHEYYWETWDEVLNDAKILIDDETWVLTQDSDLFAIRQHQGACDD